MKESRWVSRIIVSFYNEKKTWFEKSGLEGTPRGEIPWEKKTGVGKIDLEKTSVEKSGVEKSGVEETGVGST